MGGGLFRTIFIILLVYYGFRFLRRVVFPFLLRLFIKKATQGGKAGYKEQQKAQKRKEGEVHIEYIKDTKQNKNKTSGDVGGEYVDFEEIKPD